MENSNGQAFWATLAIFSLVILAGVFLGRMLARRKRSVKPSAHVLSAREMASTIRLPTQPPPPSTADEITVNVEPLDADKTDEDESEPTAEELTAKYWPSGEHDVATKADAVLEQVRADLELDWEDNESEAPAPSDFVLPLTSRGCSTADLLIVFYAQTGLRLGGICADILPRTLPITVDDLAAACQRGRITLDIVELEDLIHSDMFYSCQLFLLGRQLGWSLSEFIDIYGENNDELESDVIVSASRHAGYSDREICQTLLDRAESWGAGVVACLDNSFPTNLIVATLHDQEVDPEELDSDLTETDLAWSDRINLVHALLHMPPKPAIAPPNPPMPSAPIAPDISVT